jgi:hypothetical protein
MLQTIISTLFVFFTFILPLVEAAGKSNAKNAAKLAGGVLAGIVVGVIVLLGKYTPPTSVNLLNQNPQSSLLQLFSSVSRGDARTRTRSTYNINYGTQKTKHAKIIMTYNDS